MKPSTVLEVMAAEHRRPRLFRAPGLGVLSCAAATPATAPTSEALELLAVSNRQPSRLAVVVMPQNPSIPPALSNTQTAHHPPSFQSPPLFPTAYVSSESRLVPSEKPLGTSKVAGRGTPTTPASRCSTITTPVRPGGRMSRARPGSRWCRGGGTRWRMRTGIRTRAMEACRENLSNRVCEFSQERLGTGSGSTSGIRVCYARV
jgi:hypothetical protein